MAGKAEVVLGERIAEAQAWFRQAHEELKAAQGQLAERQQELLLKQADIEKVQEVAENWAAEAARTQHQAALKSQEEDLAVRKEKLATLRGKDEELEALVVHRTWELEQKHQEAFDA